MKNFQLLLSIGFLVFAGLLHQFETKPAIKISKQDSAFNLKNDKTFFINLGLKRMISSILWSKTLLESDLEHYKKNDLNSWMYLRFNTILNLDPYFYEAALYGGQYLSIIKDDIEGAEDIYNKGLQIYPNDYDLNFNSGFHYMFEMKKLNKALSHFEKIKFHQKAPYFLPSIIAKLRLRKRGNDYKVPLLILQEALKRTPKDSYQYHNIELSYISLKARIDLDCLNSSENKNCKIRDPYGRVYPFDKKRGKYTLPPDIKEFKLFLRD